MTVDRRLPAPLVLAATSDLGGLNGAALHLIGLARALCERGHAVTIVAPQPSAGGPDRGALSVQWTSSPRRVGLPGVMAVPLMWPALRRLSEGGRLYMRSGIGTLALVRAARLAGFKQIVVEANGWFADDLAVLGKSGHWQRLAQRLQIAEANAADRLRVVTAGLGRVFEENGVDAEKIHTISNGTDLTVFRPGDRAASRRAFGIADDAVVLGFVGNLWPVIDLPVVFEATRQLATRVPRLEVHIVGDGVSRAVFEAASRTAVAAGIAVRWHGALAPAAANHVLAAADVAVAPFVAARNARIGLSPLKLYDYAAAGRVIVATDLPGIADLRGQPWLQLARPHDAAGFADAVVTALAAAGRGGGAGARRYAEANFGWNQVADRVSGLFDT